MSRPPPARIGRESPLGPGGVPPDSPYARRMVRREDLLRSLEEPARPGEAALVEVAEMLAAVAWTLPGVGALWALVAMLGSRPPPLPVGLPPLTIGVGLLCALLSRALARRYSRARRATLMAGPLAPAPGPSLPGWGRWVVFWCAVVALSAVQVRLGAGSLLQDQDLGVAAIVGGAVVGAALLVGGGRLMLEELRGERWDEVPPATSARIVALRAEGRSLRQIAHTLTEEGRGAPGGEPWRGRRLRGVLFAAGVHHRRQQA